MATSWDMQDDAFHLVAGCVAGVRLGRELVFPMCVASPLHLIVV